MEIAVTGGAAGTQCASRPVELVKALLAEIAVIMVLSL